MRKLSLFAVVAAGFAGSVHAQDVAYDNWSGAGSFGAQETLFSYDDQEPWKHGYRQIMPYYGGWHSFRPYNYHHVFGQTQAAAEWGMPLPYSQQFWLRYQTVPGGNVVPFPQPTQAAPPTWTPQPAYGPPAYSQPAYGYGGGMMPPAVPPVEQAPQVYQPAQTPAY